MLGAGSKKMPTSKSLLLGHRWGTSPIEKRGRVNTLVTANAEWFSDEKLMLLFFAKILVMPWTNTSLQGVQNIWCISHYFSTPFSLASPSHSVGRKVCGIAEGESKGRQIEQLSYGPCAYPWPSRNHSQRPEADRGVTGAKVGRGRVREDKGRWLSRTYSEKEKLSLPLWTYFFLLLIYIFYFFIVVQVQLSPFSPHHGLLPHPSPLPIL